MDGATKGSDPATEWNISSETIFILTLGSYINFCIPVNKSDLSIIQNPVHAYCAWF